MGYGLWKYCTFAHCEEFLLSLRLLEGFAIPPHRELACLYALSNRPEAHYTLARVPKRGGGWRQILRPDALLKGVQRNLLAHVLAGMPVSPCATAYRKGTGILQNAAPHAGKPTVLRLDIADFFPSITYAMVYARAFPRAYFPPAAAALLTSLCCCRDTLPQGAPSSPAISNLVMRPFDAHMEKWCTVRGITYTRYCDDMVFSGDFCAYTAERKVDGLLSLMGFSLNRKKTRICTRAGRQQVTGAVVNQRPQAPREYRRALRQELYYCAKFGLDSHLERTLARVVRREDLLRYLQSLQGRVGFVLQLNPQDAFFREARTRIQGWMKELPEA